MVLGVLVNKTFEEWSYDDFELNGYEDRDVYAEKVWNYKQVEYDELEKQSKWRFNDAISEIKVMFEIIEYYADGGPDSKVAKKYIDSKRMYIG